MKSSYVLLIHGPFCEQWLSEIKKSIEEFKFLFSKIILVSYVNDVENYKNLLKELDLESVQLVIVKDLINPGFFNINRQLLCVHNGLANIDDNEFVFKLRNDQVVNFNKVVKYLTDDKIATTNCYTRKDRFYHPSDMFLAAKASLLKEYYSMPLSHKTHLMVEMENIRAYKENPKLNSISICPEKELCLHYLNLKKYKIKNTEEDSLNSLKKYFVLMNSWNIDFRWHKKRTNFFPKNSIILPHYFSMAPFAGGPIEKVSCYLESDITGKLPSIKDMFYLFVSISVWYFFKPNLDGFYKYYNKEKFKNISRIIRYKFIQILPYFLIKKEAMRLKNKIIRG